MKSRMPWNRLQVVPLQPTFEISTHLTHLNTLFSCNMKIHINYIHVKIIMVFMGVVLITK